MFEKNPNLTRAYNSLQGLIVGDCFGETFFVGFAGFKDKASSIEELIQKRELAITEWFWTDDSQMSFSIFKNLKDFGEIEQYALAQSFADRYDTGRGYGSGMHQLMRNLRAGANWTESAKSLFEGQGSWGNGSAMRVAPIGAYFADDLNESLRRGGKIRRGYSRSRRSDCRSSCGRRRFGFGLSI